MNLEQLVNSVEVDLALSDISMERGLIVKLLNEECRELLGTRLWSFGQKYGAVATLNLGQADYPLPSDFAAFLARGEDGSPAVFLVDSANGNKVNLDYESPELFFSRQRNTNGTPSRFTVDNKTLWVDAPPDSSNSDGETIEMGYRTAYTPMREMKDEPPVPMLQRPILAHAVLKRIYGKSAKSQYQVSLIDYTNAFNALMLSEAQQKTSQVYVDHRIAGHQARFTL